MSRTERITIITIGTVVGAVLLVLLWSMYMLISDVRNTVSSVDGIVREIAQVQGVQETVLNRLDTLPSLGDGVLPSLGSDEETPVDTGSADSGMIRPGRPSVSARQLWDDFDANQVRAAETYSEPRVWAVSGTVDSVQYGEGYIFVGLDGLVRVGFSGNDYGLVWLGELDKGQHLGFECAVIPVHEITRQYSGEHQYLSEDGYVFCISPDD